MSHYYTNDPTLDHDEIIIKTTLRETMLSLTSDIGVFSRRGIDYGSRLLIESITLDSSIIRVVDMGCGYGPIGLFLAAIYPEKSFVLCDVNSRATTLAKRNATINNINNVEIIEGHLFDAIKGPIDAVVTNPPIRAGKQLVFELYDQAHDRLNKGGFLAVVIQKKQGAPSTKAKLESLFGNCDILSRNKGYYVFISKK